MAACNCLLRVALQTDLHPGQKTSKENTIPLYNGAIANQTFGNLYSSPKGIRMANIKVPRMLQKYRPETEISP